MEEPSYYKDHRMEVTLGSDGIVRCRWAFDMIITQEAARDSIAAVERVSGGRRLPLLVYLDGVARITREARTEFAKEGPFSAIALFGKSPVVRVIANFQLGLSPQIVPTKFFSAEAEALAWLQEQHG